MKNRGDGRFFHLDFHVIGHFHDNGGLLHIGNESMYSGVGHDPIAGLQGGNELLLRLLSFHLRAEQNEYIMTKIKIKGTNAAMPPPGEAVGACARKTEHGREPG